MSYHPVHFNTQDGLRLSGHLYTPRPSDHLPPWPAVIMTQGFATLKEHYLIDFARYFKQSGWAVLLYDHRHFGESDGMPRQDIHPEEQASDYQDAWRFLSQNPDIDPHRIALWGSSLSAGHVLSAAVANPHIACIVAQAPFISGSANAQAAYSIKQRLHYKKLFDKIQKEHTQNLPSRYMTVVSPPHPCSDVNSLTSLTSTLPAVFNTKEAWQFFTQVPTWHNQVTWLSLARTLTYEPCENIELLTTPTLMIHATHDTINLTEQQNKTFARIKAPKRLKAFPGGHFDLYHQHAQACVQEACLWLQEHLMLQ